MKSANRIFSVASEDALVELISHAQQRIVAIAPAMTARVVEAIQQRLQGTDVIAVTVILDSDPIVYRIGYGDIHALDLLRKASNHPRLNLRQQLGVRIGVLIADDTTMVFSPVPKSVEIESDSMEAPNAIVLAGSSTKSIAAAAGTGESYNLHETEVGRDSLETTSIGKMQSDLKTNPPISFDVTRKLSVFSSKVQYVEFSATNYKFTTRQIQLPPELVDVADEDLKDSITSRIRAPYDAVGKLEVVFEHDGKEEKLEVDGDWLRNERKRIEDEYTFQINNFGRVILRGDRNQFDSAAERFKQIIEAYQVALSKALQESKDVFTQRIVDEFMPRWRQNPPKYFERWGVDSTDDNFRIELRKFAEEIFDNAVSFEPPVVRTLYKNVSPENVDDNNFLDALRQIMRKRRVPQHIIDSLFESGRAAPERGGSHKR